MLIVGDFRELPVEFHGAAVAIGNFDGVHLGHRAVISEAGLIARASGLPWGVLTLEPHPRSVFNPKVAPFRLTPFPEKARLIAQLGPEFLAVIPFDLAFSRIAARSFVEQVLIQGLQASHVVCGHDFAFGHGRKGTPELLLWLGDEFGFGFTCVQEVRDANGDGEPYSSTRIRDYLRSGDPVRAARLLGRPFDVVGTVVEGDRRGRTIGFPTANLLLGEYIRPATGVYAVRAGVDEGDRTMWLPAMANLGMRPTFDGTDLRLEVHLFDFDGDLYGQSLRVAFVDYLRAEKKFDGIDALTAQLREDSLSARKILMHWGSDDALRSAGAR
jgi:riboflavin kinase/FMN adenylyltransferase